MADLVLGIPDGVRDFLISFSSFSIVKSTLTLSLLLYVLVSCGVLLFVTLSEILLCIGLLILISLK